MGRRTAWWGAACRFGALRAAVVTALVCGTAVALPGRPAVAEDAPSPYAFAPDARSVAAATGAADAARLEAGRTYKSSLPVTGDTYYRLDLDATSNAYVSATAIPPADAEVSSSNGLRISVRDADGGSCSFKTETFAGGSLSSHAITAVGMREISADRPRCAKAGTYSVVVERVGTTAPGDVTWDLELSTFLEPPLKRTGATTAPEPWNSDAPRPVTDKPERRSGGAGFASAVPVGQGAWRSDLTPGQTLYYKVPVGWGQHVHATAELAGGAGDSRIAVGALELSLHSPVRASLDEDSLNYRGKPITATLEPLPPVRYENRYGATDRVKGMRFAGSYYLVVHLAAHVAERFGDGPYTVTLRVRLSGSDRTGPGYAGQFVPQGVFAPVVGAPGGLLPGGGDGGGGGGGPEDDTAMTVLAVSGIGGGTVVLVVLGVWTVVGRRRARAQIWASAQKPAA
ncbi:hypothetical protein [Streptomyces sp. TRM68416]|uniref:hypothetical protein n=1 Tax=Streptomyces sp. TRM68416 TaxID=2758412 RepID=UPI001661BBD2|nr:hypothetical protein [Streptomyces sp. TRM68416]MBD0841091.1 hypothetical protein [Streptomyces sp. TRM68416]